MRPTVLQAVFALLLPLAAACGDDATMSALPPPPPPAASQDGLWIVSGSPPAILRLDSAQLTDTGQRVPATILTTPSAGLTTLSGVAFDDAGNLWVASDDDSVLLAFAPGALASSGAKAASTVLWGTRGSLSGPIGLAFDARQRLWVVNHLNATVVCFDPAQLARGGAQTPAVTLSVPGSPVAIAFDTAGSLWVSDNQLRAIYKYTPAQLAVSGAPPPALVLTGADSLVNPTGLAFDAAGTLWVANNGRSSLLAFSPAQLAGAGPSAPHIVITSNAASLTIPIGLAFQEDGSLWVVGGTGVLSKFAPASLGASGAPAPSARLKVRDHVLFWSVALWPKPAGLPLH
jgi:DNA-binding beta-propeller fold protein YncE